MKSPFPGVDPFLEQRWGDFHTRLMVYISDQIDEQLPNDLQARVEESIAIDIDESKRHVFPDVTVSERYSPASETRPSAGVGLMEHVAEPLLIPVRDEPPTMRNIVIVDASSGHRVVTAIELLSPANKQSQESRTAYLRKQEEYLAGGVNLVEIDLIRRGGFIVAASLEQIPHDYKSPYIVCIRRATRPNLAGILPIFLQNPVPSFRIPLRPTDEEVLLRLQPLLDDCYRRGRYGSLDYTQPVVPSFDSATERWIDELLKKAGKRN